MSLSDKKVLSTAEHYRNVQAQVGTMLNGTVAENKKVFDDYPELIKDCYNGLIDNLESTAVDASGASQVGLEAIAGVTGTNIQTGMESLKDIIDTNATTASSNLGLHTSNTSNPHSVTASQIPISVVGIAASKVDTAIVELKGLDDLKLPTATAAATYETIANANALFKNVTFNSTNGQFTFTKQDNTTVVIDTALETIPTTMRFFEDPVGSGTYYLGIYDAQDTLISKVNVSALFNPIEVGDTSTIDMTQTTSAAGVKTITAAVKDSSIGASKLDATLSGRITALETAVASAVTSAEDTATINLTIANNEITAAIVDHSVGATQLDTTIMGTISQAVTDAQTAATNAGTSATNAATSASAASESAISAASQATSASGSATVAENSAAAAGLSEVNAAGSATTASNKATEASGHSTTAQSWAVGGTGTRTGEDTNNAKYWCEQAGQIAGGVFVTSVNGVTPAGGISGPITVDADHVSDTDTEKKFTTTAEKTGWNAKYNKPASGIPDSDISSAETWNAKQDALPAGTTGQFLKKTADGIAWDNVDALPSQAGQAGKFLKTNGSVASWDTVDMSVKEDKSNKVTSISASSTDTQYPSAKCVYDIIGNIETLLSNI